MAIKIRAKKRLNSRILRFEPLESRRVFAVYLPDTFATTGAQPVGAAFNGGEQLYFAGHSGNLQFEFGQTPSAVSYSGSTTFWNRADVESLVGRPIDELAGRPSLYTGANASSGIQQQHVVYRTTAGGIVDTWGSPWTSQRLVTAGVVSDPTASNMHGGRQIVYVGSDNHIHFMGSATNGATWSNVDLNALYAPSATANASAATGVTTLQIGDDEFVVYRRTDGMLGVFQLSGGAWTYSALSTSNLTGFTSPSDNAAGALEGVSYNTNGTSTTTNVGWLFYRNTAGHLQGIWRTGGVWRTAQINTDNLATAPSAAFDPVAKKLSVAYVDTNQHLHLLTEAATWTNVDYHAGATRALPLASGPIINGSSQATGSITFDDGSTVAITATAPGTDANGTFVVISLGSGATTATYDASIKRITVNVAGNTSKEDIATAIDGLADFSATSSGTGFGFVAADDAGASTTLAGGALPTTSGSYVRPDLYYRSFTSPATNTAPSLQLVWTDQSNHVQNTRVTGSVLLDTTAYLENYHITFGYGIVNAATAVAYALGSPIAPTGAAGAAWNLTVVNATNAWTMATGRNVAVFALDSGADPLNTDPRYLPGRDIVNANNITTDNNGHGTGVAGIIAGQNDGSGVTGVAYNSRVVPVKIGDDFVASESAIISGIDYATSYVLPAGYAFGTRIINMSFASLPNAISLSALRDKLYATSNKAVFVAAAGNQFSPTPELPGGYAAGFGIIAGAIDSNLRIALASGGTATAAPRNYLLAPGVDVATSALVGGSIDDHRTTIVSGTSAAAAHISGVIALMLEANPSLTPKEIENILVASASPVVSQSISNPLPFVAANIYWAGGSNDGSAATALLATVPDAEASITQAVGHVEQSIESFDQLDSVIEELAAFTSSSRIVAHRLTLPSLAACDAISLESLNDAFAHLSTGDLL